MQNNQMNVQEKSALAVRDLRKLSSFVEPKPGNVYLVVWQSPEEENKILSMTGETDLRGRRIKIETCQPFVIGQRKDEKTFVITGWVSTGDPSGKGERINALRFAVTDLVSQNRSSFDLELED